MPSWAQQLSLSWYVPLQCLGMGVWPQGVCLLHLGVSLPGGHLVILSSPTPTPLGPQVNMLIGIIVFNKLMARDGISDKSKKQRAG